MRVFELLTVMKKEGWTPMVYDHRVERAHRKEVVKAQRKLDQRNARKGEPPEVIEPSPAIVPIDYRRGDERRWWMKPNSAMRAQYLRCLLAVSRAGPGSVLAESVVPHWKPERFYLCMREGVEYHEHRRRAFRIGEVPALEVLADAPRPRERQRRRKGSNKAQPMDDVGSGSDAPSEAAPHEAQPVFGESSWNFKHSEKLGAMRPGGRGQQQQRQHQQQQQQQQQHQQQQY